MKQLVGKERQPQMKPRLLLQTLFIGVRRRHSHVISGRLYPYRKDEVNVAWSCTSPCKRRNQIKTRKKECHNIDVCMKQRKNTKRITFVYIIQKDWNNLDVGTPKYHPFRSDMNRITTNSYSIEYNIYLESPNFCI